MFHTHCVVFSSLSVGLVMLMSVIEQYLLGTVFKDVFDVLYNCFQSLWH